MPYFVATILIETVAFPCRAGIIIRVAGNFNESPEAAEERRILKAQVEQYIIVRRIPSTIAECYRRKLSQLAACLAEWNKISRRESPQQFIDLLDCSHVRRVNHDLESFPHCCCNQTAGGMEPVSPARVEVDFRHSFDLRRLLRLPVSPVLPGCLVVRLIKNWVSSGTGRPVAPFSLPDFQAVPAMSRCAQRYFWVNRARKQAAVMVPAARPPILATSAKLLFSCS